MVTISFFRIYFTVFQVVKAFVMSIKFFRPTLFLNKIGIFTIKVAIFASFKDNHSVCNFHWVPIIKNS